MPYVITETCIRTKGRACVDACPVDCIYEGATQLYIHPDECIDCVACEAECPVTAIFPEEDVPQDMQLVRNALYRRTVAYGATARTKACARFARRITPFLLLAFPICVAVTGRWPAPRDNGSDIDMWPGLGCYVFASLELVQLRLWALANDDA